MKNLQITTNSDVESIFNRYPDSVRKTMLNLRKLILETAEEIESIREIEETLKWGEPSYLVKKGSTIRIDWKEKNPNQYAMYFSCTSKLVYTFREVYGELFTYDNNRAILFDLNNEVPRKELKKCIEMALKYHSVKNMPLLGK